MAQDITRGFQYNRPYIKKKSSLIEPVLQLTAPDYNSILLSCLAHENVASRKPVFENFDKQVQGRTLIETGSADAGVLQPFNSNEYPEEIRNIGVVLGSAQNPRYGKIDAYLGASNAVIEAVQNVAATGAQPLAITDCLCFGNPEKPEQMAEFVDAVHGIAHACNALKLPIISGNVSLYNESKTSHIPPSPIICCIGKLDDITTAITPAFKQTDSLILLVGERKNELGGSIYYAVNNKLGANVPQPDGQEVAKQIAALHTAATQKLILAAHDISDGGLAVALAEMSFPNEIGCKIDFKDERLGPEVLLFSESRGFILEIKESNLDVLNNIFLQHSIFYKIIGRTTNNKMLIMQNWIRLDITQAAQVWNEGLRNKLCNQ